MTLARYGGRSATSAECGTSAVTLATWAPSLLTMGALMSCPNQYVDSLAGTLKMPTTVSLRSRLFPWSAGGVGTSSPVMVVTSPNCGWSRFEATIGPPSLAPSTPAALAGSAISLGAVGHLPDTKTTCAQSP